MACWPPDERDKVYALLGLAEDGDAMGIPILYDDRWSCWDLYQITTEAMLMNGDLEVLAITRHPLAHKRVGLPSWICTWNAGACRLPYDNSINVDRPFRAGGPSHLRHVIFARGEPSAWIRGIRVGTVSKLSTYITSGTKLPLERPDLPIADFRPVSRFVEEATTFCAEATKPRLLGDADLARLLAADYQAVYQRGSIAGRPTSPSQLSNLVPVLRRCVPDGSAFQGSPLPFVLRKLDDGLAWVLVGEAYVRGAMDGELMEGGYVEAETFALQ